MDKSARDRDRLDEFFQDIWYLNGDTLKQACEKLKAVADERKIHFEWTNSPAEQNATATNPSYTRTLSDRIHGIKSEIQNIEDSNMLYQLHKDLQLLFMERGVISAETTGVSHKSITNPQYNPTTSGDMYTIRTMIQAVQDPTDLLHLQQDLMLMLRERGIPHEGGPAVPTALHADHQQGIARGKGRRHVQEDDRHYTFEEMKMKNAELMKQLDASGREKENYKRKTEEYKQQYSALKNEIEQVKSKYSEYYKHVVQKLQENQDRVKYLETNETKYKENTKSLEKERDELLRRLSAVAGAKLSDNNPNLTDLSDVNRPQKLGEKYSELYDNEWTDAFEYLESHKVEPQAAIMKLLNTFEDCFEFCQKHAAENLSILLSAFSDPLSHLQDPSGTKEAFSRDKCPSEISLKVVDLRKATAKWVIPRIKEIYYTKLNAIEGVKIMKKGDAIHKYVDKCVEISWYANIQDPPLVYDDDFKPYSLFDPNITRNYTKRGKYVKYVIWPTLLLHENGPLLSKGVVHCTNNSKEDEKVKMSDGVQKVRRTHQDDNAPWS